MKLRVLAIAFFLAVISTGASWLSLQPPLAALMDFAVRERPIESLVLVTRIKVWLPFVLGAVLSAVTALAFVIIHFTVGRPLARTEAAIDRLSRLELDVPLESGGPLLSRLQRALARMAEALQQERALTRSQVLELQQTNQQLGRAQAELLASDRLVTVGKLAAGVAHEVGNPLSGILGYLSVIRARTKDQPEMREHLEAIESEVVRIDQIVRSLLDLGRPRGNRSGPVDLGTLVHSAAKLVSKSPEMVHVKLKEELDSALLVMAESGPLSQVVINLLLNAAQAMEGRGHLTVRARREGTSAVVEVEDTGPGLSPEVKERMFEPFFTTKSAGKGTGLGLAVSLHLMTSMGGKLRADNAPTGGAVFTLELPLAQ